MTKARDLANASTALSAVSATELGYLDGVTSAVQTQLDNKVDETGGSTVTVSSGTTVPLTIQNNGTGNSFVVNDVASDTSAFTVDADGLVWVGNTTDLPNVPELNMIVSTETASGSSLVIRKSVDGVNASTATLARSRGTNSSPTALQNNDNIGVYAFHGYDGTSYLQTAFILASVDGTPGTGDMPSRMTFSTGADGSSSGTERMRISADGATTVTYTNTAGGAVRNIYMSTSAPTGGSDGDVWIQYA